MINLSSFNLYYVLSLDPSMIINDETLGALCELQGFDAGGVSLGASLTHPSWVEINPFRY